ncbi:hypothetical protein ACFE04_020183 [Oxalis oulophora]
MEYENRYHLARSSKYDCLLFDLDDTLYPLSSGLARECGQNIKDYMVQKLGVDKEKLIELSNLLYKNCGTTMAGLRLRSWEVTFPELKTRPCSKKSFNEPPYSQSCKHIVFCKTDLRK